MQSIIGLAYRYSVMPKQDRQSHGEIHVEQVKQTKESKGDLVFASGNNWSGNTATDSIYMAAEPDSWVFLGEWR